MWLVVTLRSPWSLKRTKLASIIRSLVPIRRITQIIQTACLRYNLLHNQQNHTHSTLTCAFLRQIQCFYGLSRHHYWRFRVITLIMQIRLSYNTRLTKLPEHSQTTGAQYGCHSDTTAFTSAGDWTPSILIREATAFRHTPMPTAKARIEQLNKLKAAVIRHQDSIASAVNEDLAAIKMKPWSLKSWSRYNH